MLENVKKSPLCKAYEEIKRRDFFEKED